MAQKTNISLVLYAKQALAEKWGYVLGSFGQTATRTFLNQKYKQAGHVGEYNTKHKAYIETHFNKRVSDCYGLVKGYVWTDGLEPVYNSNGLLDRNQEGAYSAAKEKGTLATMPEIPGLVLWLKGHAGIYIGNGEFIECVGCPVGMRKGTIKNGKIVSGSRFTHWFKDTAITYPATEQSPKEPTVTSKTTRPTLRKGDKGEYVKYLQERLNIKSGSKLVVDGDFGVLTAKAVSNYQINNNLYPDSVVGVLTWAVLG